MKSKATRVPVLIIVAGLVLFTLAQVSAAQSQERNVLRQLQQSIAGASDARGAAVPIFLRPGEAFDSWGEVVANGIDLDDLADSGTEFTFFRKATENKISSLYTKILKDGEPISRDSPNDAKRLAAAKRLLFKDSNPSSGPSESYQAYISLQKKRQEKTDRIEPNNAEINTAATKQAKRTARLNLETVGRRNEIEGALATVRQLSPESWWYIVAADSLTKLRSQGGHEGTPALDLLPSPSDWSADAGWTRIHANSQSTLPPELILPSLDWPLDRSLWYVPQGQQDIKLTSSARDIDLEVKFVRIERPWLDSLIFKAKWRWKPKVAAIQISTGVKGGVPPTGALPCIPTAFILARNVVIAMPISKQDRQALRESISKGQLAWGPLRIASTTDPAVSGLRPEVSRSTVRQPAVQLVGIMCQPLPELPSKTNVTKEAGL